MTAPAIRTTTAASRWASLTRAEFTLLRRNGLQVIYAIALPLATPFLFRPLADVEGLSGGLGMLVSLILAVGLSFVSFYNTLSAAVNRREDQVLTRLRAGEAGDATILAALVSPGFFLGLVMSVGMIAVSMAILDLPVPANIPILALTLVATVVLFLLAGLATTIITRTAESAQITSLPVIMFLMLGPSLVSFRDSLPGTLARIGDAIPTTAMTDVLSIAWFGGELAETARPLAVIGGWIILTAIMIRTRFRWSRRG